MRGIAFLLGLSLATAASAATPQERLDRALAGRVAGEPVDCLNLRDIRSSRIIDGIGILYQTTGGTYYLNRPDNGARSLRSTDVQLTDTRTSQLCSIDVVRLLDSTSRIPTGFVGLGKFIPYPRARTATAD
ncbi:hypothetical protein ABC347_01055 [Sphingomonas sp. 1P06PA]|uniref:hypothetical protein n=1 Tax=Sphingomonas sp. 1P06PA TaxID=554121 RepID=UPI0039A69336